MLDGLLKGKKYQVLTIKDWLLLYNFISDGRIKRRYPQLYSKEMVEHIIYVSEKYDFDLLKKQILDFKY